MDMPKTDPIPPPDALLTSVPPESGLLVCTGDILCFPICLVPLVPAAPTTSPVKNKEQLDVI